MKSIAERDQGSEPAESAAPLPAFALVLRFVEQQRCEPLFETVNDLQRRAPP
jgi:hypothetical protein